MSSIAHADHLAYLSRKLDAKERELTIREREIAVDEARLVLERDKFEWVKAEQAERSEHMADLHSLRGTLQQIVGHADEDDAPVSRNRGRA